MIFGVEKWEGYAPPEFEVNDTHIHKCFLKSKYLMWYIVSQISQPWVNLLKKNIEKYLERLETGLKETDPNNYSMYTGSSG